jgi:hypothetical protein
VTTFLNVIINWRVRRLVQSFVFLTMTTEVWCPLRFYVRGCTGEFSCTKVKKKFWFHICKKNRKPKKVHKAQFMPPPKSVISTFHDGGQYSPVIIISRCQHRVLLALCQYTTITQNTVEVGGRRRWWR